jgi:hypothetical protein
MVTKYKENLLHKAPIESKFVFLPSKPYSYTERDISVEREEGERA